MTTIDIKSILGTDRSLVTYVEENLDPNGWITADDNPAALAVDIYESYSDEWTHPRDETIAALELALGEYICGLSDPK